MGIFAHAADLLDPPAEEGRWADDPVGWCRTKAGAFVWSSQREILEAVRDRSRVAVKAAHSTGKSFTAAHVAAWWLDPETHPQGSAFVLTTAPTFSQVRTIIWKELRRVHERAKLPGRLNQTEWWLDGEIVGIGRKPADWDPDAIQGHHAEYVLVIIDEASGVPEALWDAADSLSSNESSRVLAIGNPTNPTSHFKQVADSPSWHTIRVDGLESPNFTGEPVPRHVRRLLIDPAWVEARAQEWGEDSAMFISRVRGEFPTNAEDGAVPWSWADGCRYLDLEEGEPVELGVDVGGGGDETVIALRRGPRASILRRLSTEDPKKVEGAVLKAIRETGATACKIDAIGIGWGVTGGVKEKAPASCVVTGVKVSESARNPDKFKNKRSELWWDVGRELSRTRGWDLGELDDDVIYELTQPRYSEDASGRIVIESKDDLRKRIRRSPDAADALLLCFYDPPRRKRSVRARSV